MISNFSILILVHFVSDFFFQPEKWAVNKDKVFKYLLFHSIQYALPFLIVFYYINVNLLWGIWIFATHMAIDSRKVIPWWNKKIKRAKNTPEWLTIVEDQLIHILVLIPIILHS